MIKLLRILGIAIIGVSLVGAGMAVRYISVFLLFLSLLIALFGIFIIKMSSLAAKSELEDYSELEQAEPADVINTNLNETVAPVTEPKLQPAEPTSKIQDPEPYIERHIEPTKPSTEDFYEYSEVASAFNTDGTPYIHTYSILNVAKLGKGTPGACIIELENGRLTLHKSRVDINALMKRNLDSETVKITLLYERDFPIIEYDELADWLEYCIRHNCVNQANRATIKSDEKEQHDLLKSLQFRDRVKGA